MKFFIPLPVRVPTFIKWGYPSYYVWDKPAAGKVLYLTFDDGPIPEVTEWVLDTLSQKRNPNNTSIPATFFCIGDNVRKHPEIFNKIINNGHAIGNHTFNHLKGWGTPIETYLKNTHLAELEMANLVNGNPNILNVPLFRPPYGKLKRKQAKALSNQGYQIIMYRTLAYDWDPETSPEKCLKNVISRTQNGDIIVFHDSVKAFKNMRFALPKMINHFLEKGYRFEKL